LDSLRAEAALLTERGIVVDSDLDHGQRLQRKAKDGTVHPAEKSLPDASN
jgi:hypothetical protein